MYYIILLHDIKIICNLAQHSITILAQIIRTDAEYI